MFSGGRNQIRVAIAGVGNCASSLVQAVSCAKAGSDLPGVAHERIGPYRIADIEFVAAFDVDARKVGQPLSAAIFAEPNCTTRYVDVPDLPTRVHCGPVVDGIGSTVSGLIEQHPHAAEATFDDVQAALKEAQADVLICYLPVGSPQATAGYAEAALACGVALVNCNPEPIAVDEYWQARFAERNVPLLGDDIKSQLGATTLHRTLLDMCTARGAVVERTYQLNVGGNTDFLNMRDPSRASSKRTSKVRALRTLSHEAEVSAGPSDYAPYLRDHKVAYLNIEGHSFLGMPFVIEAKLIVEDSPNSAGVVVDAIRAAKLAADLGIGGVVEDVCAYLFKSPATPYPDGEAIARMARFAASDRQ